VGRLDVLVQHVAEIFPAGLRDQDGVAVRPFHLRNGHISALLIPLYVKVKVFVFYSQVFVLWSIHCLFRIAVVVLVNEFAQVVLELGHAVGWDENLKPGVSSGEGFRDLEEPSPRVLLEIHVILFIVLVHHLGLELPLLQMVRVKFAHLLVEVDKVQQVLVEDGRRRERHENLVLSAVGANLGNFDEATALVFLHVQVEPFAFQHQVPGRKVPLHAKGHLITATV